MDHFRAQAMIDKKVAESFDSPFEDLMEWVMSIYSAVGIKKSISRRISVRLRYLELYDKAINQAVAKGRYVPPDVLKQQKDRRKGEA